MTITGTRNRMDDSPNIVYVLRWTFDFDDRPNNEMHVNGNLCSTNINETTLCSLLCSKMPNVQNSHPAFNMLEQEHQWYVKTYFVAIIIMASDKEHLTLWS